MKKLKLYLLIHVFNLKKKWDLIFLFLNIWRYDAYVVKLIVAYNLEFFLFYSFGNGK